MGNRVEYNSESLAELHNKIESYNETEKPRLVHPEYDIFETDIYFTKYGEIASNNNRVDYTITICDLNRDNLKDSRSIIVTDFIEKLYEHFIVFDNHVNDENFDECLEYFRVTIEDFIKESNIEYEYSLVRKTIIDDFEYFLEHIEIDFEDEAFVKEIFLIAFLTFRFEN